MMAPLTSSKTIFDRYLQGELSLADAADAMIALLRERKATGASFADLPIKRPDAASPSAATLARAQALFDEIDRRIAAS